MCIVAKWLIGSNDIRLVCEKLTVFPYAWYTIEFLIKFPCLWYSQVQDRSGGWREIHVQKCIKTNATRPLWRSDNTAAVLAAMLAAAQSIPAGCHETKSPVWKSPLGELRDEKGRCYFIRPGATRSSQITLRRTCYLRLEKANFTHTPHTQPFYSSMDFVRDNLGEPLAEETFTHSHLLWSSIIVPYLLHPSTTIHGILPVLFPQSPSFLWSTSWPGTSTSYSIHFFTQSQSLSSFRNTCPYHCNLFRCSTEITSSSPSLSLNPLLGILSCGFMPHIHLTILISAWTKKLGQEVNLMLM